MTSQPFLISGVRITHDRASLVDLEAAAHADWRARIDALLDRDAVSEAVVLQTCNRIEEYVVTDTRAAGEAALADFAPDAPDDVVVATGHQESLRHLLRVAAGLDSQVLGEDQILGQVRTAYAAASECGAVGPVLDPGLLKAIHVGERARTETGINDGTVSLGSAAIQLAERECGLDGATALVVGAGEMGAGVARALADVGLDELRLLNRSVDRAAALAESLPVDAAVDGLDALARHLRAADVAITSTGSPDPLVDRRIAIDAGRTLIIDLAQPRDVAADVADVAGVSVHDLDALETVTRRTHEERREAAADVERIVREEFELLLDQYKRRRADAVIKSMYQGGEEIKRRELSHALSKLDAAAPLSEEQRAVVEQLVDAVVSQLLAVPTKSLRDAAAEDDWTTITTAIELFDPDFDGDHGLLDGPFEATEGTEAASADTATED